MITDKDKLLMEKMAVRVEVVKARREEIAEYPFVKYYYKPELIEKEWREGGYKAIKDYDNRNLPATYAF